ncbi:fimbrillin family protein [Sphingobacterium sp. IITKGP-BTPF85]|uniref:fimbrillin family protein n=1 Tax=Sphingobacterium sp. IITKGP-BTPF85 TaxID=1338009 RepID=UPI0003FE2D8E|nr:fimbrillin family protein [Sphingobacterium sp. IITKGP-BTPF85]
MVVYACRKNQIRIDQNAVHFTATIVEENQNRAIGTTWQKGDEIGIFMIESGMPLSTSSIVNGTNNHIFL